MNTLTKSTLSAAIALTLVACGSGGGGVAGIGGSGFISSGTVTGFGSVFVNGVKFETSGTVFDIDDSGSGTQDDLAIGMVVTVNGTVNADGITGNATSISFDDQLQGPISAITAVIADPDGENRSFSVLGTTVRINAINTVFDVTGVLTGTVFDFDTIAGGNSVEISGFFNTAGELIATRVELKAIMFNINSDIVELKGTVSGFTDVSAPFTLTGLTGISIDASAAAFDDLPNGLTNGAAVEVKGTCSDATCSTLSATRVEGQNGFDDADKISLEGLITDFVESSSSFKINGVSVNASNAILSPSTLVLRDGARVEVEGPISNNVIQALTVELRGGNARVHASVTSIDPAGNFVVTANGQTIAVTVTTATERENPVAVDNFVRVRGFENEAGGITATRVEVRGQDDDVIVQGNLDSIIKDDSITVLGVSFQIDDVTGETEFNNKLDATITQDDFISLAPVDTLVKVKDKTGPLNGIADEIDIEAP